MYEVHPNLADQWVLYHTGDGCFDVVAWFLSKKDAEFAREMFENRQRSARALAGSESHAARLAPGAKDAAPLREQVALAN